MIQIERSATKVGSICMLASWRAWSEAARGQTTVT
jgi:hypothetical protein